MRTSLTLLLTLLALSIPLFGQGGRRVRGLDIPTEGGREGIVPVPMSAPAPLRELFRKYTRLVAPNGRPIHLFAQSGVSDAQLVRAREIMRFYLTNAPGTQFGADKATVANRMANEGATLVFFDSEESAFASYRKLDALPLAFQDLYATEAVVEGSAAYFANTTRDATLEEVFHLVHDAGIIGARPDCQRVFERATVHAMTNRIWFANEEWIEEGSTSHEYIISVIDVFYGFWGHNPHENGDSFHGEYLICDRDRLIREDPLGLAAVRRFLPADFSFDCRLDPDFWGVFKMHRDPAHDYTLKSMHLTNVTLRGIASASLEGNDRANRLVGNQGKNRLEGRGGDDHIDGGAGEDVAVFRGPRVVYQVERGADGAVFVRDHRGYDGRDQLVNIEWLVFEEGKVAIERALVDQRKIDSSEPPAAAGPSPRSTEGTDDFGMDAIEVDAAADGIVALPEGVHPALREVFRHYARVVAPNGAPIHILAEGGWRRDQIRKARSVLEHMLRNAPGTEYGADKSAVANAMASQDATLVLFDTEPSMDRAFRGPLRRLDLRAQDLRSNECPVEGTADYLAHRTRDASYEEILHFVHDYGIRPALPAYDAEMQRASDALQARDLWEPWPEDDPDSHRNEYIAAAYDNYLDLWSPAPTVYEGERIPADDLPPGSSHFGAFRGGNSRAALKRIDPKGYALIEKFFPPYLTYRVDLPADFAGEFSIAFDPERRYTSKSRHLRDVSLTGTRNANLRGNAAPNRLGGNAGNNRLFGGGGDDRLEGGKGRDRAVYRGKRAEYRIVKVGETAIVTDTKADRDGRDELLGIESLQFADGEVEL